MNKTTPFFNHKNILMDQNKCRSKRDTLKKIKMRGCVAVCFSSFSISYDRLNAYAKQVKVNEFLRRRRRLNLCLVKKTKFYLIFQIKLFPSSFFSKFLKSSYSIFSKFFSKFSSSSLRLLRVKRAALAAAM